MVISWQIGLSFTVVQDTPEGEMVGSDFGVDELIPFPADQYLRVLVQVVSEGRGPAPAGAGDEQDAQVDLL